MQPAILGRCPGEGEREIGAGRGRGSSVYGLDLARRFGVGPAGVAVRERVWWYCRPVTVLTYNYRTSC
jgi:hypothetical protein